ncbi:DNA alkylation repair protein [Campylobacter corcagiensis]|uniref:DNA alkylation repair protein n=1 Tax=Campylobacter corcagiensis TaxID=1448857 RepID=A0A7M1LJB8_9BACT|nr:DNA alkylation repair protein [Campylobacter corcagiensis]QKF65410.1 AlkD-like DNA glycosylase [Campylobacter corcagiensis]QOQ88014.1 DNA alkylation repair protein [Campylobacter corcagiensis]
MIDEILLNLEDFRDEKYAKFQNKLIKTDMKILGIRTPVLRKFAKKVENLEFLKAKKREIYELNLLEAFVLSSINLEFKTKLEIYNKFIKRVDNWALIDAVKFKEFDRNMLFGEIKIWLISKDEFIKRAGYVNLLYHFVDERWLDFIFSIKDNNLAYYDTMGHAWLISECMARYPSKTFEFLKDRNLKEKTFKKAVSKSLDSFRVSEIYKQKLKGLRLKS